MRENDNLKYRLIRYVNDIDLIYLYHILQNIFRTKSWLQERSQDDAGSVKNGANKPKRSVVSMMSSDTKVPHVCVRLDLVARDSFTNLYNAELSLCSDPASALFTRLR